VVEIQKKYPQGFSLTKLYCPSGRLSKIIEAEADAF